MIGNVRGDVLRGALTTGTVHNAAGAPRELSSNLPPKSVLRIQQLIRDHRPERTLETGMAMGISTMAILYALAETGRGHHVAVDPMQTDPTAWDGVGLEMVRRAGLESMLELIVEPGHAALPHLLRQGRRFNFILIDGWHSFDYAFVDYFYADLLLEDGGLLLIDDAEGAQVHQVCRFIETHKAYETLGPRLEYPLSPLTGLRRRLRPGDHSHLLQVYRKQRSTMVPHYFADSDFYPFYRLHRLFMRLSGQQPLKPF